MVRHVKERATSSFAPKSSRTRIRISSGKEVGSIMGSGADNMSRGAGVVDVNALSQIECGWLLFRNLRLLYERTRHWPEGPTSQISEKWWLAEGDTRSGIDMESHDLDSFTSAPSSSFGTNSFFAIDRNLGNATGCAHSSSRGWWAAGGKRKTWTVWCLFLLEGVEKSTIVTSLIKESFVAHVSLDYMLLFKPIFNVFRSNTLSRKLQFRQKLLRRTSQPILLTPEVEQTLVSTRLIVTNLIPHSCTTRPPSPRIWNPKSTCHLCRIFYRQSWIIWSNTNVLATAFSSTRR